MIRTFLTSTKRLLEPRALPALTQVAQSSDRAALYDVRRSRHVHAQYLYRDALQPLRPSLLHLNPGGGRIHIRWAASSSVEMPNPSEIVCNMLSMLKCVDLQHLRDAPEPVFWTTLAVGGSQLVIPFLEVVGGFSPVLTMLQLNLAAVVLGFSGGMKWGLGVSSNPVPPPTWETMRGALLPAGLAVTGLLLPYPLGFLTVASGMVTSLYLDLKSCAYPPWGCAASLFLTLTTVSGLALALVAYVLFSNGQKSKKKAKPKEEAPPPPRTEEDQNQSRKGETFTLVEGEEKR